MVSRKKKTDDKKVEAPKVKARDLVRHKSFGEGIVRKKTGKNLVIQFEDGEKFFQYPEAFDGGYLEKIEKEKK